MLFAVLAARRPRLALSGSDWILICQTALLTIGLAYSLQFWGQQYVTSGLTAVVFASQPLFTFLIAHTELPNEPLTTPKILGVLLGIIGVAVIFADQLRAENILAAWGCGGFLIAAAAMAFAQVRVKGRGGHIDPMVLATFQMALGGATLLALGIAFEGNPAAVSWSASAIAALAYLSLIGSALAFVLFYWLLRHMEVGRVMSMALVHPVVAVVAGWIVLDEVLSWRAFAGTAGVMAGLALILGPRSTGRRRIVAWDRRG